MVHGLRRLAALALAMTTAGLGTSDATEDGAASTGASLAERVARLESSLDEERVRRGAKTFARACAVCHGRSGRGDGPAAADLDPAPRDLTTRQFRFRSTSSGALPRPEDLERTIRQGLPGSSMPAFDKLLSSEQIAEVIDFLESLQPAETRAEPAEPLSISPVSPATPAAIEEGRAVYMLTGCWTCHGLRGDGRGPSAAGLLDENERPIRSTDFRYDPLKGGHDAASVVTTLRTGLNGAPMPSYDEAMVFAREDFEDLSFLPAELPAQDREDLEALLRAAPSRADLERMGSEELEALRDRRLAALAHYVLSLDRRRGLWYRLFREQPERERRD